jgi:hypothetical protein
MGYSRLDRDDDEGGDTNSSSGFDTNAMPDRFNEPASSDYSSSGSRDYGGSDSKPLGEGFSTGALRESLDYFETVIEWTDDTLERLERSVKEYDLLFRYESEIEKAKQVAVAVAQFGFATAGLFAAASLTPVAVLGVGLAFGYAGANLGVTLATSTKETQKWSAANYHVLFNVYGLVYSGLQMLSGQSLEQSLERSSNLVGVIDGSERSKTLTDHKSSRFEKFQAITEVAIELEAELRDYRKDMCSDEHRLGPRLP